MKLSHNNYYVMSRFREQYRDVYINYIINALQTYSENRIDIWESYFYNYSITYVNKSDITPIPYIKIYPKLGTCQEDTANFGDSLRIYIFDFIPICPFPFCGTIVIHKFTNKIFVKKYTVSCFLFRSIISFNKKEFIKIILNILNIDI